MAFRGGKVERGVEAAEGGVAGEARVEFEQHLRLNQIAIPRRRHQPLTRRRAPERVPHSHQHRYPQPATDPSPPTQRRPRESVGELLERDGLVGCRVVVCLGRELWWDHEWFWLLIFWRSDFLQTPNHPRLPCGQRCHRAIQVTLLSKTQQLHITPLQLSFLFYFSIFSHLSDCKASPWWCPRRVIGTHVELNWVVSFPIFP